MSCVGPVDSGFVKGVNPAGNGGEAGCSIRRLSREVEGGDMKLIGSGRKRNGTVAGYVHFVSITTSEQGVASELTTKG